MAVDKFYAPGYEQVVYEELFPDPGGSVVSEIFRMTGKADFHNSRGGVVADSGWFCKELTRLRGLQKKPKQTALKQPAGAGLAE